MTTQTTESVCSEFTAALDFALDHIDGSFDGMDFLTMWREGQWPEIEANYPDWVEFREKRGLPPRMPS